MKVRNRTKFTPAFSREYGYDKSVKRIRPLLWWIIAFYSVSVGLYAISGLDSSNTSTKPQSDNFNCSDFASQGEAQKFFEDQGGPVVDSHNLDKDGDGVVCETL